MTLIGAGCGALAAWIAYMVREPEPLDLTSLETSVLVDEITISDELWAIVGLTLLGSLVCGSIAALYVLKRGPGRVALALLIAAPLGAAMCWGARWAMDLMIYASLGGPQARVGLFEVAAVTFVPGLVWELLIALGLTMPIVLAVGPNTYVFVRGLIGAGLVILLGQAVSYLAVFILVFFIVGAAISGGGESTSFARTIDVIYLFTLGAAAGLAFAVAEAIYKPAWLKSYRGRSEGRTWALAGRIARIGSQEGLEVFLPPDGTVAPLHAQIQAEEDGHFLVDIVGGTSVNGGPATSKWLQDGDQIGVGTSVLIYRTRLTSTRKEQPSAPVTSVRQASLLDPMGNRHLLVHGRNVVGREPGCHVALTWEPSVSRHHAEVVVSQGRATVLDLGSTNGTFVNGEPVSGAVPVSDGAEIVFGRCRTRIEL
jgi:pSer/pThr/pTyr-binding forkhead associated (FHA) protein